MKNLPEKDKEFEKLSGNLKNYLKSEIVYSRQKLRDVSGMNL